MLSIGSMSCVQAQSEETTDTTVQSEKKQSEIEAHLKADMVNKYIWRGLDLGYVSLQPEMSIGWKGLNLTAWGSVGLSNKDDASEIDLTLSYETGGLSFGIVDYWNTDHDKRYFYYKKDGTGHSFEGFIGYDFGFLRASWQTFFAGNDYQEGFSVTNLSLRATKDIQITKSFALPLFGQLIANPTSQQFYFVFGFTLNAL